MTCAPHMRTGRGRGDDDDDDDDNYSFLRLKKLGCVSNIMRARVRRGRAN